MKAKEYFELYDEPILRDQLAGSVKITKELVFKLSDEFKEICEKRNVKTEDAILAVIRELNQKWNSICGLYEKKYKQPVLNRNEFNDFWKNIMPELKNKL